MKLNKYITAFTACLLTLSTLGGQLANAVGEDGMPDDYYTDDYSDDTYTYDDYADEDDYTDDDYTDDDGYTDDDYSIYGEVVTTVAVDDSDDEQQTTTAEGDSEQSTPTQKVKRGKALISEYDESLSIVSYEFSVPQYTYEEDFSEKLSEQQTEEAKQDIILSMREGNPVSSARRGEGADLEQIGHVGEIPIAEGQGQPSGIATSDVSGEFTFVTYGWGHGVGLSQNGANYYATYAGWSYQDILAHYYPNTYLMNTGLTETEELTIKGEPAGDTVSVVAQIVNREIGGTMHPEAIKAQAVAVYTYLKYHDDDSADLLGKADPPQNVIDACTEVLGQALYYNGAYALTMFSASSGGCTANCRDVFYADIPYLISVPSEFDEVYDPHYGTVTYYPASEVKRKIEKEYNIKLSDDAGKWIQPIYSKQTGYVTEINIDDQLTIKGYEFKILLDLKSSKFNLTYTY